MRYPWKDSYGYMLEVGDTVEDTRNLTVGHIELNRRGVPCLHMTMRFVNDKWEILGTNAVDEAYQRPLFDEHKSKFYWFRHRYTIPDIVLLKSLYGRK